jgi:hypothetical protein
VPFEGKVRVNMAVKLGKRDKRALKLGAVCAVAVLVFVFATKGVAYWMGVRRTLAAAKAQMQSVSTESAMQASLRSIVPVFEMPQSLEKQKFLFRDKLNEQLNKAGIKSEPLQVVAMGKSPQSGYKLMRLKCSSKCKLEQVLNLLASLKENPYLVGVEQLRLRCNPKNKQEIEMDLVVSTFVK